MRIKKRQEFLLTNAKLCVRTTRMKHRKPMQQNRFNFKHQSYKIRILETSRFHMLSKKKHSISNPNEMKPLLWTRSLNFEHIEKCEHRWKTLRLL